MNTDEGSRREFLAAALAAGATLAGCSSHGHTHEEGESDMIKPSGEMVKLLSVDGEVIEVDKAFLKPVPDLPQVNIAAWSELGKNIPHAGWGRHSTLLGTHHLYALRRPALRQSMPGGCDIQKAGWDCPDR